MIFLLFLFSGVSLVNLLLTLFFPYPAPIIGIGLQFVFFILSLFVFISRVRKKRGMVRSLILTSYHTSAFILILYAFFNITLPNREVGETDAFVAGINGLLRHFQGELPQMPSRQPYTENNAALKISDPPSQLENTTVEDPF